LGLRNGILKNRGEAKKVFFLAYTGGMFNRGTSRGYVYSRSTPGPIVESFRNIPNALYDENMHYLVYIPLKDDWYMFEEFR
jgi:hypothetical protein